MTDFIFRVFDPEEREFGYFCLNDYPKVSEDTLRRLALYRELPFEQYSTFKDKYGKNIFVGDYVCRYNYLYEVVFHEGAFMRQVVARLDDSDRTTWISEGEGQMYRLSNDFYSGEQALSTVVGNIHQHSNLIFNGKRERNSGIQA